MVTNPIEDNGNQGNSSFSNANNYGEIESRSSNLNIKQFHHSTTINYVKALLEKWNADIYFL